MRWLFLQSSRRAQTDSQGTNLTRGAKGELRYELRRATAQERVQKLGSGACGDVGAGGIRALPALHLGDEESQILFVLLHNYKGLQGQDKGVWL